MKLYNLRILAVWVGLVALHDVGLFFIWDITTNKQAKLYDNRQLEMDKKSIL